MHRACTLRSTGQNATVVALILQIADWITIAFKPVCRNSQARFSCASISKHDVLFQEIASASNLSRPRLHIQAKLQLLQGTGTSLLTSGGSSSGGNLSSLCIWRMGSPVTTVHLKIGVQLSTSSGQSIFGTGQWIPRWKHCFDSMLPPWKLVSAIYYGLEMFADISKR